MCMLNIIKITYFVDVYGIQYTLGYIIDLIDVCGIQNLFPPFDSTFLFVMQWFILLNMN